MDFGFLSKELFCVFLIIEFVYIGYKYLIIIICMSDKLIWVIGYGNIMKFYNLYGQCLELIKIKLGNMLEDIIVIKSGNLVYIDVIDKILNVMKNKMI